MLLRPFLSTFCLWRVTFEALVVEVCWVDGGVAGEGLIVVKGWKEGIVSDALPRGPDIRD